MESVIRCLGKLLYNISNHSKREKENIECLCVCKRIELSVECLGMCERKASCQVGYNFCSISLLVMPHFVLELAKSALLPVSCCCSVRQHYCNTHGHSNLCHPDLLLYSNTFPHCSNFRLTF